MNSEGIILGVIIAFELDRNGNDYVVRGTLELFNRPLIKITNDLLQSLRLKDTIIYTNQKGIIFKNILGRKLKYIVRKNSYLYTTNTIYNDFKEYLNHVNNILIIDPKYPFLDNILVKELIEKHKQCDSDLTYIKGINQYSTLIPNIYIINVAYFKEIFQNEYNTKTIEINNLISKATYDKKRLNFIETYDVHKVLVISNGKIISSLESLLLNRK
mgnify:CR=1 FL=1